MQRAGSLIKRLLEQYEANASADSLMATAKILLTELQQKNINSDISGKKVAVIMPAPRFNEADDAGMNSTIETVTPENENRNANKAVHLKVEKEIIIEPVKKVKPTPFQSNLHLFDDIPTFAYQQKEIFELNDSMVSNKESLNESLKADKAELGSILKEAPVRDLRKAIGINDRFVFINELFRGDEDMYERSIKTINSFNILPEAEYWIKRELKLKQAWDESTAAVQLFDQLVRRRFS